MNLITTAAGNHLDLHTTQGRYEYVGEFLNKHAANSDVWKCLTELHSRIATLESENATLKANDMARTKSMGALLDRIAELEAAQQWHPASEPPEDSRRVLIGIAGQYNNNYIVIAVYLRQWEEEYYGDCDSFGDYDKEEDMYYCPEGWYEISNDEEDYKFVDDPITGWRDLPPLPERSEI